MAKSAFFLIMATAMLSFGTFNANAQGMAVNTTGAAASSSAILDASSTTQGILVPRMTDAQKMAITSPAAGLLIYQTDGTQGFYYYNGTAWSSVGGTASSAGTLATFNTPGSTLTYNFTLSDLAARYVMFDFQDVPATANMNINFTIPAASAYPAGAMLKISYHSVSLSHTGDVSLNISTSPATNIYRAAGGPTTVFVPTQFATTLYTDGTKWIEML